VFQHNFLFGELSLRFCPSLVTNNSLFFFIIIQVWFVGPVAKTTGDIGFELGFVASAIAYFVLRRVEQRLVNR
jgi:hypothetical protein